MPCYYTGTREGDLELAAKENGNEIIELTRMLCATLRKCDDIESLPENVQTWWKKHKYNDSRRTIPRQSRKVK